MATSPPRPDQPFEPPPLEPCPPGQQAGDKPGRTRKRRLVPILAVAGVLAVIGAVALAGCQGRDRGSSTREDTPEASRSSSTQTVTTPTPVTYTVTATVPLDGGPNGVAVDPGTHTVYVTGGNAYGTVSVIDGSTHTVTATVPVGKFPGGVAVDPGTHTVYVTNSEDATVSVIDGRRTPSPPPCPSARPGRGGGGSEHPHRLRHQPAATTRCR